MELREELPSDRPAVRDVHLQAFGDHGLAVADLVDTLRDTITPEDGLSLVADLDRQVVGHVMFTGSLLDAPRRLVEVQVLSPLAVTPALHQRGIGSALVRHGLGILAERSVPLVFLEGDPGYYSRFGFTPGGGLGFRKPSLRMPDGAFQAVQLPEYEPRMTGTLVYAEPFWRHDAVGLRDPRHSDASADTAVWHRLACLDG
jgi:putative acetyltransferase